MPFTVIFKFVTLTNGSALSEILLRFTIFNVSLFIVRIIREDNVRDSFGIQTEESQGIFTVFKEEIWSF